MKHLGGGRVEFNFLDKLRILFIPLSMEAIQDEYLRGISQPSTAPQHKAILEACIAALEGQKSEDIINTSYVRLLQELYFQRNKDVLRNWAVVIALAAWLWNIL